MKNLIFTAFLLVSLNFIVAQTPTTILFNDYALNGKIGDVFTIYFAGQVTVDVGQLGHSNWNFSNVTSNYTSTARFIDPATAPFSDLYTGFNSCMNVLEDQTNYWYYIKSTPDTKVEALGESWTYQSTSENIIFNGARPINFPLNFQDTWNYTGQEIIKTNSGTTTTPITINNVVDAWGSLTLPGGKVVDALRYLAIESRNNGGTIEVSKLIFFLTKSGDFIMIFTRSGSATTGTIQTGDFIWYSRNASTYTVVTSSNPSNGGTTTGGGTFNAGSSVNVNAVATNSPGAKFQFVNWTESGTEVSKSASYTFTLNSNRSLVANFQDITSVEKEEGLPTNFSLSQNYPNPFNPSTIIKFGLPHEEDTRLVIYNLAGQEILELINNKLAAGNYSVKLNANKLSSGIYFYKLNAGNYTETKKMMLIK